jgi:hypothetical protein
MWPIQLAFRLLISCRIFLCSLTLSNTSSFLTSSENFTSQPAQFRFTKQISVSGRLTLIHSTSFYASLIHKSFPQTPVSLRHLYQIIAVHCENYTKHIAICVKNAELITLQHVLHVVTIVLHTDEDKATSVLLIFQSCNVTFSIQFRCELAAMYYVTLLDTAGEMRSNGYLITVHSFQCPTLYYD